LALCEHLKRKTGKRPVAEVQGFTANKRVSGVRCQRTEVG